LSALPKYGDKNPEKLEIDPVDIELARRSGNGDRQAFSEIYHRHLNQVYGLSLRLTADTVKAETLTQDAFIKAWSSLGSFSGRGTLAGWLSRLTVNLWRDRFRFEVRQAKLQEEAALSWENDRAGSEWVVPLLTALDLEKSLRKLPQGARTVFVLHDVEGYKHHEIAEMLELTTGTVKSQLHRARKLLRVLLTESRGAK
jgi:RNA polymerase sigma-70 factor, ECF subfamily